MENKLQIFREFDQIVRDQYDTIPLRHLGEVNIGYENSVSFFARVIRSKNSLKSFEYSDFKFFDELQFISKDVKYYTALLYFFKPYITNSAHTGTYYQSQEDRRYMMFASVGFQSIYNYWDRIGDLLDKFFRTGLNDSSIYLSRVLNNFPSEHKNSQHYKWLDETFKSKIKNFLGQRDDIVHSYQLETEYYWKVIEAKMDTKKTTEIQMQKEEFPEKFKNQIELMILGFEHAVKLIDELPDKEEKEKRHTTPKHIKIP